MTMIDLLGKCKAVLLLLAIVVVWLVFIVLTPFGWLQVVLVKVCFVVRWAVKGLKVLTRRFKWHGLFMLKVSAVMHRLNDWCFTLWLSNDQYINSVFFGDEDHSISGRVGSLAMQGSRTALVMEKVIDFIFFIAIGQRNHCRQSIEFQEVR